MSTFNSLKLRWSDVSSSASSSTASNHSHSNHHGGGHHHHHGRSVSPSTALAGLGASSSSVKYVLSMENTKHRGRFNQIFSGPTLSFKVTKLNEASRYRFRIQANNESGPGRPSDVYEFWTVKTPPHSIKGWKSFKLARCVQTRKHRTFSLSFDQKNAFIFKTFALHKAENDWNSLQSLEISQLQLKNLQSAELSSHTLCSDTEMQDIKPLPLL
jgi:hypothetical protein